MEHPFNVKKEYDKLILYHIMMITNMIFNENCEKALKIFQTY